MRGDDWEPTSQQPRRELNGRLVGSKPEAKRRSRGQSDWLGGSEWPGFTTRRMRHVGEPRATQPVDTARVRQTRDTNRHHSIPPPQPTSPTAGPALVARGSWLWLCSRPTNDMVNDQPQQPGALPTTARQHPTTASTQLPLGRVVRHVPTLYEASSVARPSYTQIPRHRSAQRRAVRNGHCCFMILIGGLPSKAAPIQAGLDVLRDRFPRGPE